MSQLSQSVDKSLSDIEKKSNEIGTNKANEANYDDLNSEISKYETHKESFDRFKPEKILLSQKNRNIVNSFNDLKTIKSCQNFIKQKIPPSNKFDTCLVYKMLKNRTMLKITNLMERSLSTPEFKLIKKDTENMIQENKLSPSIFIKSYVDIYKEDKNSKKEEILRKKKLREFYYENSKNSTSSENSETSETSETSKTSKNLTDKDH